MLWTAGSQPSTAAQQGLQMPFPRNERGAMRTDDTLRVVGHPRVFALGDLASAAGGEQYLASAPATAQVHDAPSRLLRTLRPAAFSPAWLQVAFQQANYAAWNIWAAVHNRPLLPFKYQHLGDMMSLGPLIWLAACACNWLWWRRAVQARPGDQRLISMQGKGRGL